LVRAANEVIDERRVQFAFQPVVQLGTREVVGYEALMRGPQGSVVASPLDLLSAASTAGRLAELDWLCAVTACVAAKDADLHPSTSVFLNIEPTTLLTPCPEDLLQVARQAQDQLRVFVELKEESLLDHPRHTLEALTKVREIGWGAAIDGASASAAALALLPLVEPDVIKLDLRLAGGDPTARAAMADGARQYREQAGATILVQGIEEAEDVLFARAAGADFGQGWHFGKPGPLVPGHEAPRAVVPLLSRESGDEAATPFDVVAAHVGTAVTERRVLEPMAEYIAAQGHQSGPPALLLVSFERRRPLGPREVARLLGLLEGAAFGVVLGPAMPIEPAPRRQVCQVAPDHSMRSDWTVLVLGPRYAAALVARDLGEPGPASYRQFRYAITHQPSLVARAARAMLRQASN
jgi:EAL domain-containing protein (putative c-di-GMP-specific phosphodiesterase class I)